MQVDLDVDATQVAGLPRFQQAQFQQRRLRQYAIALGALAAIGLVLAFFVALFAPQSLWGALLVNQSGGLLVLIGGLQAAGWVTEWRARAMHPALALPVIADEEVPAPVGWYERLLDRIGQRWVRMLRRSARRRCGWPVGRC